MRRRSRKPSPPRLSGLLAAQRAAVLTSTPSGRFTPQESDHLLRIARVYARTHHYFGTHHQASAWLSKPALALGDLTPWSLLDADLGAEQVMTLLDQLEYGVLP